MEKRTKSKAKQVILSIAIAIVLTFFIAYGISVFYEAPKYENFCGMEPKPYYSNQTSCEAAEGKWQPRNYPCPEYAPEAVVNVKEVCPGGYCDADFKCRTAFEAENEIYNRNVFIASLIFGMIFIILGIVLKLESVSAGIMGGGVLLVFYGVVRYWGELGKYWRLLVLGLVLAALIWVGYKKFGNK